MVAVAMTTNRAGVLAWIPASGTNEDLVSYPLRSRGEGVERGEQTAANGDDDGGSGGKGQVVPWTPWSGTPSRFPACENNGQRHHDIVACPLLPAHEDTKRSYATYQQGDDSGRARRICDAAIFESEQGRDCRGGEEREVREVEFVPDDCNAPFWRPALPGPATALPRMNMVEEPAMTPTKEPNLEQQQKSEKYPFPNLLALSAIYTPS
ncbi:hypothetical protein E5D57_002599 [Metarhizium anisopliae]|nr:hypothetical protein E5D57_002599 [Metarhizium anisopliae]